MAGLLSDHFDPNVRRLGVLPYPQGALSGQKGPVDWSNWVAPQFVVDAIKSMELPGRALRGENISADDVTKMAMDTMGGGGLLSRAVPTGDVGGLLGLNVWHGGPNRWAPEPGFPEGRPRMDKMGTGEGNQAYGRGFYSAEHPDVARTYQGKISAMQGGPKPTIDGKPIENNNPVHTAAFELARHGGDRKAAADFHASVFLGGENNPAVKVLRSDQTLPEVALPGTLYKLDIPDADAAKFLDYDAPLSQQPPNVQAALPDLLKTINADRIRRFGDDATLISYDDFMKKTGEDLQDHLAVSFGEDVSLQPDAWLPSAKRALQEEAASEALARAGIPGLKYFDQGSRGTREGLRNYVTWDQDVLDRTKILERDGKPTSANAEPRLPSDIRPAKENLATVVDANTVGGRVAGDETVSIDLLAGGASRSARAQKDIDNIADSMSGSDGFIERLIVDQDNNVIEGAHRLEALRKLGVKEVPVTRIIDPQASFTGDDIAAMKNAMSKVSPIHSDHKNQIITQLGEMLADPDVAGDFSKVFKVFDSPKGFEKHFEAALKILDRN